MRIFPFAALTGALTMAALPVDAEACINGMEKHRKPKDTRTFQVDIDLADKPELSQSINETALANALSAQTSALQSCLTNRRLRLTDGGKEQITLSLVVAPSGTVTESDVLDSSYWNETFYSCVISATQNMNFGSLRSGKSEKIYITIGFRALPRAMGGAQAAPPDASMTPALPRAMGGASPASSPSRGTSAPATPKTSPNDS